MLTGLRTSETSHGAEGREAMVCLSSGTVIALSGNSGCLYEKSLLSCPKLSLDGPHGCVL